MTPKRVTISIQCDENEPLVVEVIRHPEEDDADFAPRCGDAIIDGLTQLIEERDGLAPHPGVHPASGGDGRGRA